jgi:HEAT repeat protein
MRGYTALLATLAVGAARRSIPAQEPVPATPYHAIGVAPFRGVQGDPADSLYRVAHDLLARGEYGRSAQVFKEIAKKYPKSRYQDDLPYNEAFARYRIGTTKELETAAHLLEPPAKKLLGVAASNASTDEQGFGMGRRRTSEGDVVGLYIRVNQVLAQRGNSDAASVVKSVVQPNANSCGGEDGVLKREAMGALSLMDPQEALPIIKRVLSNSDECTADLRRSAVFMLGRQGDAEAATILAATAKRDPSPTVRAQAISWLPKLMGDAGVAMLEDVLRTEQDERIQKSVVQTLAASPNPRARTAIRAIVDRKDAPLDLRLAAVNAISNERATSDDAVYLRALYARAENDGLKQAIVGAVARSASPETDEWILNIAKNPNEASSVRGTAISYVMRSGTISDWIKLYDAADSFEVRSRIVTALENRKESEAADKLVEIVRSSTVPSLRTRALTALTHRKDPRVPQLLEEIMSGRKG